jgi:hypothetical protein
MSVPSPPRFDASGIRPKCSNQALEFYWIAPASADQTGYTLSCPTDPSSPYNLGSTTTYTKITGLTNGQEYAYQIVATNENGSSAPAFYRSVQPGFKPGVPISPSLVFPNISTAAVSFSPPASNGNATIKWYLAKAFSTDRSDPIVKYNCEGFLSTISLTGLNPASDYTFMLYAVNDPGYSLAVSTIALSPIIGTGDRYTYFQIIGIDGSNDFFYRIYNSQTGWGAPIDTGLDTTQYNYNDSNGGGSNYLYGMFYNPTTSNYAIPFVNTNGISLQTMTWSDSNDNGFALPNSYSNDTFFSYSSNYDTGLLDLQLYQPDTGLYQSTSIVGTYFTEGPPIYPIPLQNSVAILTGSNDGMTTSIVHYIWPVTQSTPIFLYQGNNFLETEPYPVNSNTGIFNIAAIYNTDYYDSVNYITEPNTYTIYNLPSNTYTNYRAYTSLPYGNNKNSFIASLYNSNTTLYDVFVWNNFSNSSNFLNPIILSNIDIVRYIIYDGTPYLATYNTNALLLYDFNLDTYTSNYIGIGRSYSVFDNGSTYSTLFTSTNVAIGIGNFVITSNATGVLQVDSNNNIGIALCSQVFGQSTIVLSSATGYASNFSSYIYVLNGYTNFISVNIPQVDGLYSNFITIQTDTGAITASSTNTGISSQTYCGSTGMVLYSNGSCDVLFNGVITSNIPSVDFVYYTEVDFALGYIYGTGYNYPTSTLTIYNAKPTGMITSTFFAPVPNLLYQNITVTPSSFFVWTNNPFVLMAQTLDDTQFYYSTFGAAGNTYEVYNTIQSNSILFQVVDSSNPSSSIYTIFDYTNGFNDYLQTDESYQSAVTTSPYSSY